MFTPIEWKSGNLAAYFQSCLSRYLLLRLYRSYPFFQMRTVQKARPHYTQFLKVKKRPFRSISLKLPPTPLFRSLESMELLTPDEIVRLTPPERLALIAQLWDSLEHERLPLTAAQEAELERRLASLDEDRRNGVTWASLKAELEQRCP